ncbi:MULTISPECIES: DUF1190 domain-containing protein [Pseudomonas]|jgi:uncharacterized protein YgiB involved in biofilm formation|uniref:DUF1190 domain-containing protein n=3 Tax=Pseudomonas fluorescens group TaxID=136843 RepID=A0AB36D4V3_9PSED|nr:MULTISPECIES: DUF1190 domain-containing protein [Pseudomonas]MBU0521842.1 DUF1190 domain-containing protein [Gammaproteobacteria bacterium]MDF9884622.1 uncharacterized protein YgiB involved in biofilm formation [Pseudomonas silensiensis]AHZ71210.1 hypothetical protein OU5_4131 [Pseudomonas mandelii JR-1]MBA4359840.1 DUF1190 domain-containing protein [Pseudomonas sp.]MBU0817727.1 DUF1190 domain-containing protein [Gammaproteobacteria bacterium]
MKRSKYVQLSLAASVAMAISGCGPTEKTYAVQKKYNFQSVQQCADEKLPVDVCSDAYMTAMAEHRRIAPVYDSQADCDADFVADWCQQDSAGKFIPKLGGFELTADGQVTQSQVDAAKAQLPASEAANTGGSGFSTSSLLTGLLIGNMLSSNRNSYYSEPVYRYRDDRGSYSNSTLSQRIAKGSTFTKSNQARYGSSNYADSVRSSTSKPVSVASSTSRGGFGSKASARSGWGGGGSSS